MEEGHVRAPEIGSLTSLRFFAALAIVVHHSRGSLLPADTLLRYPLDVGVSFFFVLSGFILTYVYRDGMRGMRRRTFYRARFARIWPASMLWVLVLVLLLPRENYLPFYQLHSSTMSAVPVAVSFVTMTSAWIPIPAYYFSFNAPFWSVSTEAFFYLLFPVVLRSFRRSWHWKLILALVFGLAIVLVAEHKGVVPYGAENFGRVTLHGITYINPLVRFKEFVLGMVGGFVFLKLRKHWRPALIVGSLLEVAVVLVLPTVVRRVGELRYAMFTTASPAAISYFDQTMMATFFVLFILVFALNAGIISRALGLRPLVMLGEISFSLYLLHQIFINYYLLHASSFGWIPHQLFFTTFLCLMMLASYASWKLVEVPARNRLREPRHIQYPLEGS